MDTLTQSIAAMLVVLLAGLYLLRREAKKRKKSCGHDCGCSHAIDFRKQK